MAGSRAKASTGKNRLRRLPGGKGADPVKPSEFWRNLNERMSARMDASRAPSAPPLVAAPLCTVSPPCRTCWFCKVAKYGPDWWLR